MTVFGIETSCDETSCAVVRDGKIILSNSIISQINIHQHFYGVVPEIASREHLKAIYSVAQDALMKASINATAIDGIAVTSFPGLVGSLVVGINFAKGLSYALNKPLIGINHLISHIYSAFMNKDISFPVLSLIISGGHTALLFMDSFFKWHIIGKTLDDSCGEAFDKVAKYFELGYPGGPIIDRLAHYGDVSSYQFPIGLKDFTKYKYNFSFSGLKTSVMHFRKKYHIHTSENTFPENCIADISSVKDISAHEEVLRQKGKLEKTEKLIDIAASFQNCITQTLLLKTKKALENYKTKTLIVSGGSSANTAIRSQFNSLASDEFNVIFPPISLCMDNAAMVAGLGYHYFKEGFFSDFTLNASPKFSPLQRGSAGI